MTHRRLSHVLAGAGVVAGLTLATAPVWATPGDKVTLCHRTDANNNPYVQITVSPDAVFKQGHDGHNGPVWNLNLKAQHVKWGDIIPPFDYTTKSGPAHYAGKNWNAQGRAVYDNGCQVIGPSESPSPTPTNSESSTPSSTPTATATSTPTVTVSPTSSRRPTATPSPTHATHPPVCVGCPSPPTPPHRLPYTGLPVWPLAIVGTVLVGAGAWILRRV